MRQRLIPKSPGKFRALGIPTVADRVVQASLMLVLEPIFEADFHPSSYGFRPRRRAWDAVAEIQMFASRSYEWVLEGDITACFDEIDHTALMGRVRRRIGDKRVLALVKAFLKAGILSEDRVTPRLGHRHPARRDPLAAAGQHRPGGARRAFRRGVARDHGHHPRAVRAAATGAPCTASSATRTTSWSWSRHPGTRRGAARPGAAVLPRWAAAVGGEDDLVHIDDGFDFLGFRIQRQPKRGTASDTSTPTRRRRRWLRSGQGEDDHRQGTNQPFTELLRQLNPVLRGWTDYFRHGVSKATFGYLRHYTWPRVVRWLRRKHRQANWKGLRRRYRAPGGGRRDGEMTLFDREQSPVTRYRYRGNNPLPMGDLAPPPHPAARTCGEPDAVKAARPVRGAGRGNGPAERPSPRRADPTVPATHWPQRQVRARVS